MANHQEKILALKEFISIDKFSLESPHGKLRGEPSPDLSKYLTEVFNYNAYLLIEALEKNASDRKLRSILKRRLSLFNSIDYDTEDRELICELFAELARLVNVNISNNLNNWLYGRPLMWLLKVIKFLKPQKPAVIEVQKQPCTKCGVDLEVHLTKKVGRPDTGWVVGRCDSCKEFNLFSYGPNNDALSFKNYEFVENIPGDQYTYEQAVTRLEQIKVFRK